VREAAIICPRPCKLTFDFVTLKVVSESCVTWATSVPILVFLGLSVLDLGPMYATDGQTSSDVRRASSLNASALWGGGHNNKLWNSSALVQKGLRSCLSAGVPVTKTPRHKNGTKAVDIYRIKTATVLYIRTTQCCTELYTSHCPNTQLERPPNYCHCANRMLQ